MLVLGENTIEGRVEQLSSRMFLAVAKEGLDNPKGHSLVAEIGDGVT